MSLICGSVWPLTIVLCAHLAAMTLFSLTFLEVVKHSGSTARGANYNEKGSLFRFLSVLNTCCALAAQAKCYLWSVSNLAVRHQYHSKLIELLFPVDWDAFRPPPERSSCCTEICAASPPAVHLEKLTLLNRSISHD